jgi:hypothetical protein
MTRRGVSESVAMKISGHKTQSVFRRHNITDEGDLKQAAKLIESGLQTDTETDTFGFGDSKNSRNSLI